MPEINLLPPAQTGAGKNAVAAPPAVAGVTPVSDNTSGGADFATVLQKQLQQPAKDAGKTEASVELVSADALKQDEASDAAPPADLNALLPSFAQLMQPLTQAAGPTPGQASEAAQIGPVTLPLAEPPLQSSTQASPALTQPTATEPGGAALATVMVTAPTTRSAEKTGNKLLSESPTTINTSPPATPLPTIAAEGSAKNPTPPATATDPAVFAAADKLSAESALQNAAAKNAPQTESFGELLANAANQHATATQAHGTAATDALASTRVQTPVGAQGWDGEVAQKVVWLSNRQENRAELTLTPPNMGKIEITLTTHGDQTNALFVSASPAARDALEQALPRLRELLAEAGISLGQATVNAESQRQDGDPRNGEGRGLRQRGDALQTTAASTQWIRRGEGLVDTFA